MYGCILFLGNGGELTLYMTGKLTRPRTEPLFSGGSRSKFPIPFEYEKVDYGSFVGSHVRNTKSILIWQQISQGKFSGIFGQHQLHNTQKIRQTSWWKASSYQPLKEWIEKSWSSGKSIYSLAFDGTSSQHYAAYLMSGYGTTQSLLVGIDAVSKCFDEGKHITSCTADDANFFIVMTKDAPGFYTETKQACRVRSTWNETVDAINGYMKQGWIITGLCYCSGKRQYLLVMSDIRVGQCSLWFGPEEGTKRSAWMDEKFKEGYHPTIMMQDPTFNKEFVVMTQDPNRSNYLCRIRHPLK